MANGCVIMADVNSTVQINDQSVVSCLMSSGVVAARTDTLYGLLARASDPVAVERVYQIKGRDADKSPIVLIANQSDLYDQPSQKLVNLMGEKWPGKVSIIVPSLNAPVWLRRDNGSVAYRLPDDEALRQLISQTGPLIAPSANPQGMPPASNVDQARQYFGEQIDIYIDGGQVEDSSPSQILGISRDDVVQRLR